MVLVLLLSCSELCGALGYPSYIENKWDKIKCACVDYVDRTDPYSITPFTLEWYRTPSREKE